MGSETLNLETRIKTLNIVLTKHDRQAVDEVLRGANSDLPTARASL